MHGFNWFDRRGTEGVGFIRALRTLLTNHLPSILPDLRFHTTNRLHDEVAKHRGEDGSSNMPIYPTIVTSVILANSLSFFGEDLGKFRTKKMYKTNQSSEERIIHESCIVLCRRDPPDCRNRPSSPTLACPVRPHPTIFHPTNIPRIIGPMLGKRVSSQATVYDALMVVAEERVRERDLGIKVTHVSPACGFCAIHC